MNNFFILPVKARRRFPNTTYVHPPQHRHCSHRHSIQVLRRANASDIPGKTPLGGDRNTIQTQWWRAPCKWIGWWFDNKQKGFLLFPLLRNFQFCLSLTGRIHNWRGIASEACQISKRDRTQRTRATSFKRCFVLTLKWRCYNGVVWRLSGKLNNLKNLKNNCNSITMITVTTVFFSNISPYQSTTIHTICTFTVFYSPIVF